MKLEKNLNRQKSEGSADAKLIKRFLFAAAAAVFLTGCAPSQGAEPAAQSEEQAASLEKTSAEGMSITSEAAGAEQGSNEGSGTAKSAEAVMDQEQEKVRIVIPTVYEDIKTQEEADEMMDKIIQKIPEAAVKAHDNGIISEKVVENARKMTIIAPGELSEAIYKLNKTMLDIAKSEKQKGK